MSNDVHIQASVHHRGSIASRGTALARAETQNTSMSRLRSNSAISEEDGDAVGPHPVEPRSRVAILPPVLTKAVDADPLCWLEFTEDSIMTSCKSGMLGKSYRLKPFSSQLTTY